MNTETIRQTIFDIRAEASGKRSTIKNMRTKWFSFYESNPKLFDAAVDISFPLTFIDLMLEEIDKLNANAVSMEQADKNVYERLRGIYVDPHIQVPHDVHDHFDVHLHAHDHEQQHHEPAADAAEMPSLPSLPSLPSMPSIPEVVPDDFEFHLPPVADAVVAPLEVHDAPADSF